LTKWLNPTVNILYALSGTLGEGVGMVCFWTRTYLGTTLLFLFFRSFHLQRLSLPELVFFFWCVSFCICLRGPS
jgi:hypothetical protein